MPQHVDTHVKPEIEAVLSRLRGRIRQYVFFEGMALVVVILGMLFWLSYGVDHAYFWASSLELPRWVRAGFDLLALGLVTAGFLVWVGLRFMRSFRTKALALVLERRFPELDDRLIAAVELEQSSTGKESELTVAMIDRTISHATKSAGELELGAVFNKRPLMIALVAATFLFTLTAGFGIVQAEEMRRWWNAFNPFDLREVYWDRETELQVRVVAAPNDRVRNFRDEKGKSTNGRPGEYKHPRGGDLTILVEVPPGKKVPGRIRLSFRLEGNGGSGVATLTKTGPREFRYSRGGLLETMSFRVRGGDFASRREFKVEVVDPPQVARLVVQSLYPAYTGMNKRGNQRRSVKVDGTQVSLPMGTRFHLHAKANKKVVNARVEYGRVVMEFGHFPVSGKASDDAGAKREFRATFTVRSQTGTNHRVETIPSKVARQFLSKDGGSFRLPFVLQAADDEALADQIKHRKFGFDKPLPFPPDGLMRIYLEDTDEIASADPTRLTVNGIIDTPPIIETQLRGIGSAITRQASIPVTGLITDDYGVEVARFDYRIRNKNEAPPDAGKPPEDEDGGNIDDEAGWIPSVFENEPEQEKLWPWPYPKDFILDGSSPDEKEEDRHKSERFDVIDLGVEVGQTLTLTVYAKDGDNLYGPHEVRGERFQFRIVTPEELMAIIYGKELNILSRLMQIRKEVDQTRLGLISQQAELDELAALKKSKDDADRLTKLENGLMTTAERSWGQVAKNHNETRVIEKAFRELLEEMHNNKLHSEEQLANIEKLIVVPLHGINEIDFPSVDQSVSKYKVDATKGNDTAPAIDSSIEGITELLEHLDIVLSELDDLVNFHAAVSKLKTIIDDEESLKKETAQRINEGTLIIAIKFATTKADLDRLAAQLKQLLEDEKISKDGYDRLQALVKAGKSKL
jgi:rubrerythrin